MENIFIKEVELNLYKLSSDYTLLFETCELYESNLYTTESVKDIGIKLKSFIVKFTNIIHAYINNIYEIFNLYINKKQVKKNIKIIEKAVKKDPVLANKKIKCRLFGTYVDKNHNIKDIGNNQYHTLITNNITYRIENIDDKRLIDTIDKFYKSIDNSVVVSGELTVNESIEIFKKYINDINKEIEEKKSLLLDISKLLQKYKNISTKHISIFKKCINKLQSFFHNLVFKSTTSIEYYFKSLHSCIKNMIMDESKDCKLPKISRDKTAMNHSKKVSELNIQGRKIELYETDRYITSEFIIGHKIYFNKNILKLPRAHQAAIIYHEIGHLINGHSNGEVIYRDEKELGRQIKKQIKKYDKMVSKSIFYDHPNLTDDSILIYLLVELEADKYSSSIVGKKVYRNSLMKDYKQLCDDYNFDDDNREFQTFVGKLRTKLL